MRLVQLAAVAVVSLSSAAFAADWVPFQSQQFRFAGLFPAAPKQDSTVLDGILLTNFVANIPGTGLCMVGHGLYPNDFTPQAELLASRNNFFSGVGATVSASVDMTLPRGSTNLPALVADGSSAAYAFRTLIVVDGRTVYQVAAAIPQGGDTTVLKRCIDGFSLTP
jgi:hypothetical protein